MARNMVANGAVNGAGDGAANGAPPGAGRGAAWVRAPFAPLSPPKGGINGARTPLRPPPAAPANGAAGAAAGGGGGRQAAGGAAQGAANRAANGAANGAVNGAPNGALNGALNGAPNGAANGAGGVWTAASVVARLEEAGRCLLCLPDRGYSPRLRTTALTVLRDPAEAYGWEGRLRPPLPDAATIGRMEEAFGWIALIPPDRHVLRRILHARALIDPRTDRPLFPWRRLAALLGADHKAVQRWHAQGVAIIVAGLGG